MSEILKMIKAAMMQQPPVQVGKDADYAANRAIMDDPANQIGIAANVSIEQRQFGGVDCELLTPAAAGNDGIVFYIHGGAFAYGSALSSRGYASVLADELGMRVVTISYRLAPEYKWPAGIDDCFEAYKGILEAFPGSKTALAGESAGGTMVLVTALRAKAAGIQMPACVVAFSPCTNLAEDLPSRKKNKGAMVVPYANVMELLQEVYLDDGIDAKEPHVSPFYGDYSGFPPMYFTADQGEVLFDDSALLVPRIREQGVEVAFDVYEDTFHSFPTIGKVCPESAEAMKRTCSFIARHLG